MTLPTWEQLDKNQEDPEKIEEAIDRKIGDHLDDPDAHVEEGQSLESHKAAVIIDHVAHSVVRDKIKFDRFIIDEHFATTDAWGKTAGVNLEAIGQIRIDTSGAINNEQNFYAIPGDGMEDQGSPGKSPFWEARVKIYQITNQIVYIVQGEPDIPVGYGFKIVNGTLYAVWWDEESAEQTEAIQGVNISKWHTYGCDYKAGESLKFYIDGVLKKEMTENLPLYFSQYIYFRIRATAAETKTMFISNFHFDADFQVD